MKDQLRSLRTRIRERRYTPATVRIGLACTVVAAVGYYRLSLRMGGRWAHRGPGVER